MGEPQRKSGIVWFFTAIILICCMGLVPLQDVLFQSDVNFNNFSGTNGRTFQATNFVFTGPNSGTPGLFWANGPGGQVVLTAAAGGGTVTSVSAAPDSRSVVSWSGSPITVSGTLTPTFALGSSSQFGVVKVDGTTITASSGILSAAVTTFAGWAVPDGTTIISNSGVGTWSVVSSAITNGVNAALTLLNTATSNTLQGELTATNTALLVTIAAGSNAIANSLAATNNALLATISTGSNAAVTQLNATNTALLITLAASSNAAIAQLGATNTALLATISTGSNAIVTQLNATNTALLITLSASSNAAIAQLNATNIALLVTIAAGSNAIANSLAATNTALLATLAASSNQFVANGNATTNWANATFQNGTIALTNLATNNGASLTNIPITAITTNGGLNGWFHGQSNNASIWTHDAGALTNLAVTNVTVGIKTNQLTVADFVKGDGTTGTGAGITNLNAICGVTYDTISSNDICFSNLFNCISNENFIHFFVHTTNAGGIKVSFAGHPTLMAGLTNGTILTNSTGDYTIFGDCVGTNWQTNTMHWWVANPNY